MQVALSSTLTIDDLVAVYCYAQDLAPFEYGETAALFLLQKHRQAFASNIARVPELLGKHADKLLTLMEYFVRHTDFVYPLFDGTPPLSKCASIAGTLEELWETSETSGDFEIVCEGCEPRRVHAFVMCSSWPYFKQMFDASLKETQERRLHLPAVDQDGGLDEEVLDMIIELAYLGRLSSGSKEALRLNIAGAADFVLSAARLYLRDHTNCETRRHDSTIQCSPCELLVSECVRLALAYDANVVALYKHAVELDLDEVVYVIRERIISKAGELVQEDSDARDELRALPQELLFDILQTMATLYRPAK
jgi:hypothetical protein